MFLIRDYESTFFDEDFVDVLNEKGAADSNLQF